MLKRKKEYRFKSCIYKITCNENGFVYIGQSINLYRRVGEHINSLRKGKGRNPYMQSDYDKYGPEAFDFDVLEYTDSSNNCKGTGEFSSCEWRSICALPVYVSDGGNRTIESR